MKQTFRKYKSFSILDLPDNLKRSDFLTLKKKIEQLSPRKQPKIAINLSHMSRLRGTLISLLIFSKKEIEERGGKFCVVCLKNELKEIWEATGLNAIFETYREEADLE